MKKTSKPSLNHSHNYYMKEALKEAKKAYEKNEVPIGAILVGKDGEILLRNHNLKETNKNLLDHAEILLINEYSKLNKKWRLEDVSMYVTLEPCIMCYGAILNSRIKCLVFGVRNKKLPKDFELFVDRYPLDVIPNILEKDCKHYIDCFFKDLRIEKNHNL